jgi:hypothetical protein
MKSRDVKFGIRIFGLIIILALICFGTVGCPPDNENGDDDDDNGIAKIISGQWEGSGNFGAVEFEVSSDSNGIESIEVIFSDYTCGNTTNNGSISINYGTPYMIDNRNIDIEIKLGGIGTTDYIALEGTFEATGDYISGDFELDNGGAVCSGSWEAEPI